MQNISKTIINLPESTVSERLLKARKLRGLNLKEISKACGISHTQINRAERGQSDPTTKTITVIAEALQVSVSWLMTGTGPMEDDGVDCHSAYSQLKEEHIQLQSEVTQLMDALKVMKSVVPGLENLNLENLRPGRSKIGPDPAKDRESVPSKKRRGHPSSPKETPQLAVEFA